MEREGEGRRLVRGDGKEEYREEVGKKGAGWRWKGVNDDDLTLPTRYVLVTTL